MLRWQWSEFTALLEELLREKRRFAGMGIGPETATRDFALSLIMKEILLCSVDGVSSDYNSTHDEPIGIGVGTVNILGNVILRGSH